MNKKSRFLQTPVQPFTLESGLTADQILARMERISFQGRNLAAAHRIWRQMRTRPKVSVPIALPLVASALANTAPPILALRKAPAFTLASRVMTIDGQTVPHDRFEEVHESPV